MSGHPQGAQYDDGYGHQGQAQGGQAPPQPHGQDSYYHDDQQYGQYHDDARGGQQGQYQQNGNDAYYDEQYVSPLFRAPIATNC